MNTTDRVEWREFIGQTRYCMLPNLSLSLSRDAALLLADKSGNPWLAEFESSVGSVRVNAAPVVFAECSRYESYE